jgi:hypothetical protein
VSSTLVGRTVLARGYRGYYEGEGGELKPLRLGPAADGKSDTPFLARLSALRLSDFYLRNTADAPSDAIATELRSQRSRITLEDLKSKLSADRLRELERRALLEAQGILLAGDDGLAVCRINHTQSRSRPASGGDVDQSLVVLARRPEKGDWDSHVVPRRSPGIRADSVILGPSPGSLFAIGTDGDGRSFDDGRWKDLPLLKTTLSDLIQGLPGEDSALFALSNEALWELRGGEWKKLVEVPSGYNPPRWVLGLLPDERTGDLLVGVNSPLPEASLLRVDSLGKQEPVKLAPVDPSPFVSLYVGLSLIRGPSGIRWAATTGGLIREGSDGSWVQDTTLLRLSRSSYPSCLLARDADLWIAVGSGSLEPRKEADGSGLWVGRPGAPAKAIPNIRSDIYSLAYQPGSGRKEPRIWYGGTELFGSVGCNDLETRDDTKQLIDLMGLEAKGEKSGWSVTVAADGEAVLALTNRGLARFHWVGDRLIGSRVELPGWPTDQAGLGYWKVLSVLPDGQCLAAIEARGSAGNRRPSGGATRGLLWLRRRSGIDQPFENVAELPWTVRSCTAAHGEILLGGDDGVIYTLPDKGPPRLRHWLIGSPSGPLRGMTWAGGDGGGLLVLGTGDALYRYRREAGGIQRIGNARDWTRSVRLEDGSVLLLRSDGVSRLRIEGDRVNESEVPCMIELQQPPTKAKRFVTMVSGPRGVNGDRAVPAYLLADRFIFAYDPAKAQFNATCRIPEEFAENTPPDLRLAVDGAGIWLGSAIGLWRRPLRAANAKGGEEWDSWDEADGLPSRQITGLAPLDDHQMMVITSSGDCLALRQGERSWRFKTPPSEGWTPGSVSAARFFRLEGETVLAIGSSSGLDLMRRPETSTFGAKGRRFEHFAARDGLMEDQVNGLNWVEDYKELWVVSPTGVSICQFDQQEDGSIQLRPRPRWIERTKGLPEGRLTSVWVDERGQVAWLLTTDTTTPAAPDKAAMLSRWDASRIASPGASPWRSRGPSPSWGRATPRVACRGLQSSTRRTTGTC